MSMTINEQIEALKACREEIKALHKTVEHLRPKAEAYDALLQVLGLISRPTTGMGEPSVLYQIDKRVHELEAKRDAMKAMNVGDPAEIVSVTAAEVMPGLVFR